MLKLIVRKKRAVTVAMSVMLAASVFSPGGCMIKVDQGLLEQLIGAVGDLGGTEVSFRGPGFRDGDCRNGDCRDEFRDESEDHHGEDDGHNEDDS